MCTLHGHELLQLAAKATVTLATARRWATPTERNRMKPATRARVEQAARKLGIPVEGAQL
jgi:DNA-binding LacI/PurR family transcriptional regulator